MSKYGHVYNSTRCIKKFATMILIGVHMSEARRANEPKEHIGNGTKTELFVHRAGWRSWSDKKALIENTFSSAQESLSHEEIVGVEIDLSITSDGKGWISHSNTKNETLDQCKKDHQGEGSFESWLEWFSKTPELSEKQIYLDLKTTDQDPFLLLQTIQKFSMDNRVRIGTKDAQYAKELLLARMVLKMDGTKVILQFPDPASLPGLDAVTSKAPIGIVRSMFSPNKEQDVKRSSYDEKAYLDLANLYEEVFHTPLVYKGMKDLTALKPDGVHFFWPEDFRTAVKAEKQKSGSVVMEGDESYVGNPAEVKRVPGASLQEARLKRFIEEKKRDGYTIYGGSAASPETMQRMMDWGVDVLMPNDPDNLPQTLKDETADVTDIPYPTSKIQEHDGSIIGKRTLKQSVDDLKKEIHETGNLTGEKGNALKLRLIYLSLSVL